jgi:chlorite dismutase
MDERPTYAYYPVYRATPELRAMGPGDALEAAHEAEILLKEWAERVRIRGVYSTVGFRPDADLMMWWVASSPDDIQEVQALFARSPLGRRLEQTWAFLGVHRPPETAPDHIPAFMRGEHPRKYVCVYPFVRSPEWYLLPREERAALLREHGEIGREYPGVMPNTTSAFGLGDWEWILAFESDDLIELVDCIRRLRDSRSRLYVKVETPFITGIRKDLSEAIRDAV